MATKKSKNKNTKTASSRKKGKNEKAKSSSQKKRRKLTKRELQKYEKLLSELREKITDEISFLSGDNVNRANNHGEESEISRNGGDAGDQGSANFDREFALNLLSSEQDVIYEIDQALQRIKDGTYGMCEVTGERIEKERLEAIPYTRYSLAAKEEMERQQSGTGNRR